MKQLYKFFLDCGRMGSIEGMFIAFPEEISKLIGKEIYFGEVLGKHSEVFDTMSEDHFEIVSEDQEHIEWMESTLGRTVSGYNPLSYYEE